MKTFEFPLKDALKNGLRPKEESPRNGMFLTAVSNGRLGEDGLVEADLYARTFTLNEDAQIFSSYSDIYVLTQDTLYKYVNSALTQLLTGITVGGSWSMADFGTYTIFGNGVVNLIRNPDTGAWSTDAGTILPLATCLCAHNGRVIIGGPRDFPTTGVHQNWVGWSDIGELSFITSGNIIQSRRNLSGAMPMSWKGHVIRVASLDKHVIVYGDNGITALTLTSTEGIASTYAPKDIHEVGIRGQRAMTTNRRKGSGEVHYFIDEIGWLYSLDANLKVTKLGYKEFLN